MEWDQPHSLDSETYVAHASGDFRGIHVTWINNGFYVCDGRQASDPDGIPVWGPYKTMMSAKRFAKKLFS